MRIVDLTRETIDGLHRVSAKVVWEDCDRCEQRIYFATREPFGADLRANPNAFLLAAVIPAMWHGERRVQVEGVVCPRLRNGLMAAMQVLVGWYGAPPGGRVELEPTRGFEASFPSSTRRSASFMSGGVDSLATLRRNRTDFDLEHPASIRDCIFVHGFDVGGYVNHDASLGGFEAARSLLATLCREAASVLIPVYTNIRHLEGDSASPIDNAIFSLSSHGAALAAVAHVFSRRVDRALVPATDYVADLTPWGSHPLLDPNYSSADVEIVHDGIDLTRLGKLRLIASWDAALSVLRTCLDPMRDANAVNCGQCEKCLRTMVQLLVVGKLSKASTFPRSEISAQYLNETLQGAPRAGSDPLCARSAYALLYPGTEYFWKQLLVPLRSAGRDDLARVVESKIGDFERHQRQQRLRARVRRFDRRFLASLLRRIWLKSRTVR